MAAMRPKSWLPGIDASRNGGRMSSWGGVSALGSTTRSFPDLLEGGSGPLSSVSDSAASSDRSASLGR